MDIGLWQGIMTAVLLVAFIGLWARTWSKKRNKEFEAAAQMPLGDDARPPVNNDVEQDK